MVLRRVFQKYIYFLNEKPWPTNIATTVVSISIGDIIAQQVIEARGFNKHDWRRTAQFAIIGGTIVAPSLLIWYKALNKLIRGQTKVASLKKVVLDQGIYAPYILSAFFVSIDLTDGKSFKQIKKRFGDDYLNTMTRSYQFWPVSQTINFCFIPNAYRILFLRVMALFWNSYLCWSVHRHTALLAEVHSDQQKCSISTKTLSYDPRREKNTA